MSPEDRSYLLSVYATERQDDQNALVVAFAIATAGITYVTLAIAYINDHCNGQRCTFHGGSPNLVLLTAPAIPLALAAFLALNLAATRLRSVHLQRLEYALQIPLSSAPNSPTAPSFHTDAGLVYRSMDRPRDKPRFARVLFTFVTLMAYVPILATLLGFTWIALLHVSGSTTRLWAYAGYGLAELIEVMALFRSLTGTRFTYKGPEAGMLASLAESLAGSGQQRPMAAPTSTRASIPPEKGHRDPSQASRFAPANGSQPSRSRRRVSRSDRDFCHRFISWLCGWLKSE